VVIHLLKKFHLYMNAWVQSTGYPNILVCELKIKMLVSI
jgi:hypothetical protein